MRRARRAATAVAAVTAALSALRCGGDEGRAQPGAPQGGDARADARSVDTSDPRCATTPVPVTTHPHAAIQDSSVGKNLVDARSFHGRIYFGYGDLNMNTGPIVISSFDPKEQRWQDHLTFDTERVERLRLIGDELWAPASDPAVGGHDYAYGTADHVWQQVDIGRSIKMLDVAERVPGEVYLFGDDLYDSEAGLLDGTFGAAAWRRTSGGSWERIFPIINPSYYADYQLVDMNMLPFLGAAALGGKIYAASIASPHVFDGTSWSRSVNLGGFIHPVTFANRIVFGALGELWSFDGAERKNLGVPLVKATLDYTFLPGEPFAIFNDSEGHLLAVNRDQQTLETTDLVTWRCIGRAPPDVRSLTSLDGVVYFGGPDGKVFGYPAPSW